MLIRVDAVFFEAMKDAGYDLDRKRLIEIYGKVKQVREKTRRASPQSKLEEAGFMHVPCMTHGPNGELVRRMIWVKPTRGR